MLRARAGGTAACMSQVYSPWLHVRIRGGRQQRCMRYVCVHGRLHACGLHRKPNKMDHAPCKQCHVHLCTKICDGLGSPSMPVTTSAECRLGRPCTSLVETCQQLFVAACLDRPPLTSPPPHTHTALLLPAACAQQPAPAATAAAAAALQAYSRCPKSCKRPQKTQPRGSPRCLAGRPGRVHDPWPWGLFHGVLWGGEGEGRGA